MSRNCPPPDNTVYIFGIVILSIMVAIMLFIGIKIFVRWYQNKKKWKEEHDPDTPIGYEKMETETL